MKNFIDEIMKLFLTHFIKDEKYFFPKTLRVLFLFLVKMAMSLWFQHTLQGWSWYFKNFLTQLKSVLWFLCVAVLFLIFVLTFQTPSLYLEQCNKFVFLSYEINTACINNFRRFCFLYVKFRSVIHEVKV